MKLLDTRIRVEKSEHRAEYFPEYLVEYRAWYGVVRQAWYAASDGPIWDFKHADAIHGSSILHDLDRAQEVIDFALKLQAFRAALREHEATKTTEYIKYP